MKNIFKKRFSEKHIKRNEEGKGLLDDILKENQKNNKKKFLIVILILMVFVYSASSFFEEKEILEGYFTNGNEVMRIEGDTVEIREFFYNEEGEMILSEKVEVHTINFEEGRFILRDKEFFIKNNGVFSSFEFWRHEGGFYD